MSLQVESYQNINQPAAQRAPQRVPQKPTTSHDILGLKRHMAQTQDRSVMAEVNQYLTDPLSEHWSLQFWLVGYLSSIHTF